MPVREIKLDIKGRTEFLVPTSLDLGACAATIVLALPGCQHVGEVTYAADRRLVAPAGKITLAGRSALNPESVVSSGPVTAGKATSSYTIAWCSPEDNRARELLEAAGCDWTRGGPTHPYSHRHRQYLTLDAKNGEEAIARSRAIIDEAGGDSTDLTVVRADPDRLRLIDEGFLQAQTEARGS
jgi:hypothetical protein